MLPSLVEKVEKNKGRMLLQGQENLLRELKWLEKEKRLNETTFSRAKREYGEYVSAVDG